MAILPTRPVYAIYQNSDGTPKYGYVEFTMATDVNVLGVGIIQMDTIVAELDEDGRVDANLIVSDNPNVTPQGLVWCVEEKIENGNVWYLNVPQGDGSPFNYGGAYIPGLEPPGYPIEGHGVPVGGLPGQVLTKITEEDYDTYWSNIAGDVTGNTLRTVIVVGVDVTIPGAPKTDYVYICTALLTVTLPDAVSNVNTYTVKRVGIGNVTIVPAVGKPSQTIDGASSFVITSQYQSIDLISDGAKWVII